MSSFELYCGLGIFSVDFMLSLSKYSIKMNQPLKVSEYLDNILQIFSKYVHLTSFVLSVNCFDKVDSV